MSVTELAAAATAWDFVLYTRRLNLNNLFKTCIRADSRFAPSQWETALLCKDVSHWLGAMYMWQLCPEAPFSGDSCASIWPFSNVCQRTSVLTVGFRFLRSFQPAESEPYFDTHWNREFLIWQNDNFQCNYWPLIFQRDDLLVSHCA